MHMYFCVTQQNIFWCEVVSLYFWGSLRDSTIKPLLKAQGATIKILGTVVTWHLGSVELWKKNIILLAYSIGLLWQLLNVYMKWGI